MGYGRVRRGLTPRQEKEQILASNKFRAAAIDDPAKRAEYERHFCKELPPKRIVRRPVDGKPVTASEHQEQSALISWWRLAHQKYGLPEIALFAVPNGGRRDMITGALLKAEGVRAGALDLILAKPTVKYAGLFIEMKVGDNKPSENQKAFITYLEGAGYKACVHWDASSAIKEIEEYLQ